MFGFMYMNDSTYAPGNQGLLDQQMALKWIQANIKHFGGDPNKVTLFGESAGAESVSFHLLSPLSQNLFNNGILQSGTLLSNNALVGQKEAMRRLSIVLDYFNCGGESASVQARIQCIQKIDPFVLILNSTERFATLSNPPVNEALWLPVVDGYFLPDLPINLLRKGLFKKCPILIGVNKNEGALLVQNYHLPTLTEPLTANNPPNVSYTDYLQYMNIIYTYYPKYPIRATDTTRSVIANKYANWKNINNVNGNYLGIEQSYGDTIVVCPSVDFADFYAKAQLDVYFYQYVHFNQFANILPESYGQTTNSAERDFLFGVPIANMYPDAFTFAEIELSSRFGSYWANFATYGLFLIFFYFNFNN
jgi:carboxylesterase type B